VVLFLRLLIPRGNRLILAQGSTPANGSLTTYWRIVRIVISGMKRQLSPGSVWTTGKRWLTVGLGVKRWLVVLVLGAVIGGIGAASLLIFLGERQIVSSPVYEVLTLAFLPAGLRIAVPLLLAAAMLTLAVWRLGMALVAPFRRPGDDLVETLELHSTRRRGPRIVAIGGGTGLPALLRGMSKYSSNLTAIVTVADDGGSSGRLRRELGVLPPGDFRNNIAALARDETLMTQLMQYRFGGRMPTNGRDGGELQGHALGNLLLAALAAITGSFDEALVAIGRVLAMRGQVLPSTLTPVVLTASVAVGAEETPVLVRGESAIPAAGGRVEQVSLEPADAPAYPGAVQAILQADLVVIGPGSLYTSILPNLLVQDIARALFRTRATRVYVCNLARQPGETDNYDVADHVAAIGAHMERVDPSGASWLDVVVANDNLSVPPDTGGGDTQYVRPSDLTDKTVIQTDLVDTNRPWRHDSQKLAAVIVALADQRR
jgi:uncharacterized cofD-like protein